MQRAGYVLVFLSLACSRVAPGQESGGRILGTITDESGASVSGARITASSATLPNVLVTASDPAGRFLFPAVPAGTYVVTVFQPGFVTVRSDRIQVALGSALVVNPVLKVGAVSEAIDVSDATEPLETTSSRTATNIARSQFDALPNGRSFHSLLVMAPGVLYEPKNGTAGVGGIQVDGASGSENAYYIDGVEVSDLRRGSLNKQNAIPFEMIQEVQVKSGGFEAEYGGATGGVISVMTRSGSNRYHGEALLQFTGSSLNSRDRGGWQISPSDVTKADFFAPREDNYSVYYPGFLLGGPVPGLQKRLFFFSSYLPEAERTTRVVDYSADPVNAKSGVLRWKQTDTRHYGQGRLDFTPSPQWQFAASYLWSPEKQIGALPNRDPRVMPPANDLSVQGGFRPAQAYTASATYIVSPRLVFSARYGSRYFNDKLGNYGLSGDPYVLYRTPSSNAAGVPPEYAGATLFSNVSSTLSVVKDITTRQNVYVDGTYLASILGRQHTLKTGFSMNRVRNEAESDYTNGHFSVFWGDTFSRGSIVDRGAYGYYQWNDGPRHNGEAHSRNLGLYAQDSWSPHPGVTINAGIRFENEFLPSFRKEIGGIKVQNPIAFGWTDKVSPRLGVAWDAAGDGKWKLSGSFGVFFDVLKYEMARGAFGLSQDSTHVYRLDNPNVFSLSRANPGALGPLITEFDNISVPINARGELEGIDPGIKPYKTREFSMTVEHAFGARLIASARYTRKDLLRAIEDIGVVDAEDNIVYVTGNPGFGLTRNDPVHALDRKTPDGNQFLVPKAVRRYDGLEFRVQGRWAREFVCASYTYSRLYGNYSGAASSDESGRSDPGLSAGFDLPFYYFDSSGSQRSRLGRLGTDRPHTLKLFGTHERKSRIGVTLVGVSQIAYSGTPDSTTIRYRGSPTLPNGRGDMGRTPVMTQTDLSVRHTIRIGERLSLRIEGEARNLFNQAAVIARVTQMTRNLPGIPAAALPADGFFRGYTVSDYVNPQGRILTGPRAGFPGPPYMPIHGLPGGVYNGRGFNMLGFSASSASSVALPNWGAYQDFRVLRLGVRMSF